MVDEGRKIQDLAPHGRDFVSDEYPALKNEARWRAAISLQHVEVDPSRLFVALVDPRSCCC